MDKKSRELWAGKISKVSHMNIMVNSTKKENLKAEEN